MDQQIFNQPPPNSVPVENTLPTATVIYAGFWRRLLAVVIDNFFMGIIGLGIGMITGSDMIISLSVSTVVGIIHTTLFDSSELMGTPGKAMLGIAVVLEKDQSRINFQTALVRFLCKYLSTIFLLLGYLIQPFTEKRQTFHDIVTNTLVIRKDPGALGYWKAFKENFNKIMNN